MHREKYLIKITSRNRWNFTESFLLPPRLDDYENYAHLYTSSCLGRLTVFAQCQPKVWFAVIGRKDTFIATLSWRELKSSWSDRPILFMQDSPPFTSHVYHPPATYWAVENLNPCLVKVSDRNARTYTRRIKKIISFQTQETGEISKQEIVPFCQGLSLPLKPWNM